MSDAGTATADDASEAGDDGYSGVLGTYPYAFRQSESRLLRSYVVLGGLFTLFAGFLFTFAFVTTVAGTLGAAGGTFTFVRSFVLFVGMAVVFPLMAPVILVARRHRRSVSTLAYDRALAASGYLLAASVYLMLVISAPAELRDTPSGATAPVVEVLYDLPPVASVVPPLAVILVGYLLHRRYR
ncbi:MULTISPECIES: hypothetical protein [Salinibaculum]|uniref:hypothetical protein n=1 Tax=Salinibaculum TaxID=2732368 RepID=UPI0030D44AF6